ncbi:MAG: hypothetical protein LBT87_11265 [Treponema sp.]|jgi:hypothetical protein|nr:hypothetical protein [Treponema sp.]
MGLLSKAAVKMAGPDTPLKEFGQRLEKYFSSNPSVQGIVFEIPPDFAANKETEDFNAMINRIIALLGSAMPLPSGRVLALLSDMTDRELIARHLEKTVNTKALALFAAKEPSKVLEYIGPYL